jgi:hypothetical protein
MEFIGGKSFVRSVEYVMKIDAQILDSEGITQSEVKDMVPDFQDQTLLNPRVKNTVGHISLSFLERDNRNLDSIKIIRRQVIQYERLVKQQAGRIEQVRLNASEARRLQIKLRR